MNLDLGCFNSLQVFSPNFVIHNLNFNMTRKVTNGFPDKCLENLTVAFLSLRSFVALNVTFSRNSIVNVCSITNTRIESLCLDLKDLKFLTTLSLDL